MVVLEVFIAEDTEVMEHLFKDTANASRRVFLEASVQCASHSCEGIEVIAGGIRLIRTHFVDHKVSRGFGNKGRQLSRVRRVLLQSLNRRDNVRLRSADDVDLDPISLLARDAVLHVKPSREPRRAKARRIDGELRFHASEGQAAGANKINEYRRQRLTL